MDFLHRALAATLQALHRALAAFPDYLWLLGTAIGAGIVGALLARWRKREPDGTRGHDRWGGE